MKKLWIIPLVMTCLFVKSYQLQAQTITSFYGTSTTFVPNVYSDLTGYEAQIWTNQNIGGTTTITYCNPIITRGYDNINFACIYGDQGASTAAGTVTIYGKVGTSMDWATIASIAIAGTGTGYIPIAEPWTLMRAGISGTGTIINLDADVYTKKR
jgi:hypothetical protein